MTHSTNGATRAIDWRGIFPVLATPFNEDQGLDLTSLRRQVDYCIERGSGGLVAPVMVGEFFTLSDRERVEIYRTCAEAAAGAVPVVAGISATSASHAAELARAAEDVGADAVIAMPPYAQNVGPDGVLAYFGRSARPPDCRCVFRMRRPHLAHP